MKIRIINAGTASPLYTQAIYHGIAEQIEDDDDPVLVIIKPDKPYICIGLHQQLKGEVDVAYCERNGIPVIRRHVGGGTVLLDSDQLFFQYIFPKEKAPNQPHLLYPYLLKAVLHTYHHFGIPASLKKLNDIQVCNKKMGGTGAGTINNATVLVGSFLYDFNYHLMAQCVNSPSNLFKNSLESILEENITTIKKQVSSAPTENELLAVFIKSTERLLKLDVTHSKLTEREKSAISLAEKELLDDEWLDIESKKLVKNGLKISAGVYLLERSTVFCGSPLTIRIRYCAQTIHTIWLESSNPKIQASLIFACNDINNAKPSIDYETIHEIIFKAVSKLSAINPTNAAMLATLIYKLGCFSEY